MVFAAASAPRLPIALKSWPRLTAADCPLPPFPPTRPYVDSIVSPFEIKAALIRTVTGPRSYLDRFKVRNTTA